MNTNKEIDLDIDNYSLDDILNLLHVPQDFDENDLKNAKKLVLKTHPDKSQLPPKYFLFYSKAYKMLYSIFEFKNKASRVIENENTEYNSESLKEEDKEKILGNFFKKNKKMKDAKQFNTWFNDQFEKNRMKSEAEETGYGDWLSSNEDVSDQTNISLADMKGEFERKKTQIRTLVRHEDINDFYSNNISASSLTGEAPQCFSSDVFSNLQYQDLRQAHRESIIPVTEEDYKNVKKFRNVNEIISFRGTQDTTPLSDRQAMELLSNREKKANEEATKRAYYFAKQVEESKKKDDQFWSSMKRLN